MDRLRMADFWQDPIPTLHWLADDAACLHRQLEQMTAVRPVVLVLPCHAREIGTPALAGILAALRSVRWLERIVIGLDQAGPEECSALQRMTAGLPAEILWLDGPGWLHTIASIRSAGVPLPASGKGRNVWLCLGWVLRHCRVEMVALHDCDIAAYQSSLLARLVYPVAHPQFGFRFCKGYYARFSRQLHGRLTRRLFAPLVNCLPTVKDCTGSAALLKHFRYPLAGEIAFDRRLAARLRLSPGWALETSVLLEMVRMLPVEQYCQSALTTAYDHRHHPLAAAGAGTGLLDAAVEIAALLLSRLGNAEDSPETLRERFLSESSVLDRRYAADAAINGLDFDAAAEAEATRIFVGCLDAAASRASETLLPAWEDLPDIALPTPDGIA